MNDTLKTIMNRKSVRKFTDKPISEDDIKTILKAGMSGPSCVNSRCWSFVVVQDKELLDMIDAAAKQSYGDDSFSCTRGAPTVIIVSVQEDQGQIAPNMIASAGCVVQNMHLAATDLGLGSVYLGSIQAVNNSFEVLYKLKLKDGFWPVAALAVGNAKEAAEEREIPVDKIYTNIIA